MVDAPSRVNFPPPFWLRNARGKRSYVGFGNGASLSSNLVFLSGLRALVERMALRSSQLPFVPRQPVNDPEVLEGWTTVVELFRPRDALLLHTSWYKETVFVGPIRQSDDHLLFVKLFRNATHGQLERTRSEKVAAIARGIFRTPEVASTSKGLIAYELIEHAAKRPQFERVTQAVETMCRRALAASVGQEVAANLIDWRLLLTRLSSHNLTFAPEPLINCNTLIPLANAHGDCTPWNIFADRQDRLCLVDFERTGALSPFADLFHLHVQADILANRPNDIGALTALCGPENSDVALLWLALYAAGQLELDLEQWEQGRRHPQLIALINAKATLLRNAICEWSN